MRYLIAATIALFVAIGVASSAAATPTCVTEDQPGTCLWNGHVRTYVDDVNVTRV